jgi:hypothetical protein
VVSSGGDGGCHQERRLPYKNCRNTQVIFSELSSPVSKMLFATRMFSQTSQNFLTSENKLAYSYYSNAKINQTNILLHPLFLGYKKDKFHLKPQYACLLYAKVQG